MAAIHKGKRTLNKQANQYLMTSVICAGLIAAYGFMLAKPEAAQQMHPLFHILPVLWFWGIFHYYKKFRSFRAGAAGESDLLDALRRLPNQYHVFTNFVIEEKGIRDEADFVVVGGNGVFVIEGKNYCGRISGAEGDVEWEQRKFAAGGKEVFKRIPNPVKQAHWHVVNVARLLKKRDLRAEVSGMLVFTNSNAQLDAHADHMRIVRGTGRVNDLILSYKPQRKLDKSMVKEIVQSLKETGKR